MILPTRTYRTHPVHHIPKLAIREGYPALVATITADVHSTNRCIIIEGFVGLRWDRFIDELRQALASQGIRARWLSTASCFLPPEQLTAHLAATLTNDPVFGRHYHGHLEEWWDAHQVAVLRELVSGATEEAVTILYGYGASLIASLGVLVYVDVPKDMAQRLAAEGQVTNVGMPQPEAFGAMYKRWYFVDWPMLNRIKRAVMPRLDIFVDAGDIDTPRTVTGEAFRSALHAVGQQPFRVKPWFAPGPWGGQWMKEQFGLSPEAPNYAWSFEVIAPENGLLLGDGERSLECAFDHLLWAETEAVVGTTVAARYGSTFPIRFDYLDTMGGTNLSCQVHPRLDYIREEFGESITQDETYYIVANKPDAQVYLGLREDTDAASFRAVAEAARDQGVPFAITDYVNSFPSQPHDLFLIPSGTVHCSGANNLVLEISATPYIYTFKIYDYLRTDLTGHLRHVHLEHAFANLQQQRRTQWVKEHLLAAPELVRVDGEAHEYRLGQRDDLFFAIHRLEFSDSIMDHTHGRFVMLNLVEGEHCLIKSAGNVPVELRFAESLIIPASVATYQLSNTGQRPCKVIKAFVKEEEPQNGLAAPQEPFGC